MKGLNKKNFLFLFFLLSFLPTWDLEILEKKKQNDTSLGDMIWQLENWRIQEVYLNESLAILSLGAVLGLHNVEDQFNQTISKNYEILGVLCKEILLFCRKYMPTQINTNKDINKIKTCFMELILKVGIGLLLYHDFFPCLHMLL